MELGYHLCHGDSGHKHFVEPENTGWLVRVANALAADIHRDIQWIHLPVLRDRADEVFFEPLRSLSSSAGTALLHASDGVSGAQARINAASKVVADFGIATECGFGRRSPESLASLMTLNAEVAQAHSAQAKRLSPLR